jgi:hypothetical protein
MEVAIEVVPQKSKEAMKNKVVVPQKKVVVPLLSVSLSLSLAL